MEQTSILSFCLFLLYISTCPQVLHSAVSSDHRHRHHHHERVTVKLFVFGDSYADTGNSVKFVTGSWEPPYGITFPGKPAGRFSDGRVLTDYIASFFGTRSPVPYNWRNRVKKSKLRNGMNFAYGGTGVFETLVSAPNMTTQIDFLQQLVEKKLYTKRDLYSSVAFVSLAGNDYAAYFLKGNQSQDLPAVSISIVNQLVVNIKRINDLGVPRILVTSIAPMGCLPAVTSILSSYQNCSESLNAASRFHNQILHQKVEELKNHTTRRSTIVILDLYNGFLSAIQQHHDLQQGNSTASENMLMPCCVGVSSEYSCGSVDGRSGAKMYTVCSNPGRSFFWDKVHPSQNGWHAVYSAIESSLSPLH
ncbi:GDSL esterase/lipase At5g03610-like isoform X2 [Argentina anserina]|uniref:GDSL esterase/lipase At5g03610-like isoform X2 n=1 Tax=Argentina anserina TaxID=57926 RepID=UPI0021763D2F|nr:GDSL esterase/lipase At5g03610-like isoform X2 [Potentilla anserina]